MAFLHEGSYLSSIKNMTRKGMLTSYDAFHSCVRNAQITFALIIDMTMGYVIWLGASKQGEASTREPSLCRRGLAKLKQLGIDVVAMCIDDSSCRNIINSMMRDNALDPN